MDTCIRGRCGLLLACLPLPAATDELTDQMRAACMSDYRRFCFGVMPGGGRIVACLGNRMAELAPQCAKVVAFGQACVEDYKQYCPNASPQNGELKRCLEQQRAKLSSGCARVLTAAQ